MILLQLLCNLISFKNVSENFDILALQLSKKSCCTSTLLMEKWKYRRCHLNNWYEKYENSIKLVFLSRKKENYLYVFLFSGVWKQMFHYHYTKLNLDVENIPKLYIYHSIQFRVTYMLLQRYYNIRKSVIQPYGNVRFTSPNVIVPFTSTSKLIFKFSWYSN